MKRMQLRVAVSVVRPQNLVQRLLAIGPLDFLMGVPSVEYLTTEKVSHLV